ncbi:hypothetical protein SJ059_30185, partial [Klebsiella aerogenes]|nr:hypothetical protein [Klebsiella aerogenes]
TEHLVNGVKVTIIVDDIPIPATGRGGSIFIYMRAYTVNMNPTPVNTNRSVKFTFSNTKRLEIFKEGSSLIKPLNH